MPWMLRAVPRNEQTAERAEPRNDLAPGNRMRRPGDSSGKPAPSFPIGLGPLPASVQPVPAASAPAHV